MQPYLSTIVSDFRLQQSQRQHWAHKELGYYSCKGVLAPRDFHEGNGIAITITIIDQKTYIRRTEETVANS